MERKPVMEVAICNTACNRAQVAELHTPLGVQPCNNATRVSLLEELCR